MKKRISICLNVIVLCVLFSCNNTPQAKKLQVVEKKPLDGYWILTEVIDSVLYHKTITHCMAGEVQASMILLMINGDVLQSNGLWQKNQAKISNKYTDSLGKTERFTTYHLLFDAKRKLIKIVQKYKTYLYRQLTQKELSSYGGLKGIFQLEKYLSNLYVQELMAGTYEALDKHQEIQKFTIHPDGKVEGFKNFDRIGIYTHFGTLWRFGSRDAITFAGNTQPIVKEKQPYENEETYKKRWLKEQDDASPPFNFKFNGDTLLLQRLETTPEDFLHYNILGEQKYLFLKKKL